MVVTSVGAKKQTAEESNQLEERLASETSMMNGKGGGDTDNGRGRGTCFGNGAHCRYDTSYKSQPI